MYFAILSSIILWIYCSVDLLIFNLKFVSHSDKKHTFIAQFLREIMLAIRKRMLCRWMKIYTKRENLMSIELYLKGQCHEKSMIAMITGRDRCGHQYPVIHMYFEHILHVRMTLRMIFLYFFGQLASRIWFNMHHTAALNDKSVDWQCP